MNGARRPQVSVVLPVYNGESFILESVRSILAQGWRDFELIVLDDGSTDETPRLLAGLEDERLRVVRHPNMGLALTLNRGIELARGEYIARQDADDISMPQRLERQVAFMEANPRCALLGTWSVILDAKGGCDRQHRHPASNGELQMRLLFDSFFVHSSVMLRARALAGCGLYPTDPERNPPEDFDLWLRIARHHEVANLPEPLVVYREVPGSISRQKMELLNRRAISIAAENLHGMVGGSWTRDQWCTLAAIVRHTPQHAPGSPDWRSLSAMLGATHAVLQARWPDSTEELARGHAHLEHVLKQARWRSSTPGRLALRARNWLRRPRAT